MLNVDGGLQLSCLRGLAAPQEAPDFAIPAAQEEEAAGDELTPLKDQIVSWVQSQDSGVRSSLCVPIHYKENLIGMLLLFRRDALAFS